MPSVTNNSVLTSIRGAPSSAALPLLSTAFIWPDCDDAEFAQAAPVPVVPPVQFRAGGTSLRVVRPKSKGGPGDLPRENFENLSENEPIWASRERDRQM